MLAVIELIDLLLTLLLHCITEIRTHLPPDIAPKTH